MHLSELEGLLGKDRVYQDPDLVQSYSNDWTARYIGFSPAIIFPQSTSDVAKVLSWCSINQVPVVTQGGNTGMVGGSVPLNGELIISMQRMNKLSISDTNKSHIQAEAGTTISEIQKLASSHNLVYGVDFGARDSATIGGTIATNAGGLNVLRYGTTRNQIVSVEAVTGAGKIIGNLNGLEKDNTGYHFPSLLCGSEGTLAIVTQAKLRLWPKPEERITLLFGLNTVQEALEITEACITSNEDTSACELFFRKGVNLIKEVFNLNPLWEDKHSTYLLCEFAGPLGVTDRLSEGALGKILQAQESVLVATNHSDSQKIWQYRELHTLAISSKGVPLKLDVTLPLQNLEYFLKEIERRCQEINPACSPYVFGHSADGNLHLNILNSEPAVKKIEKEVLEFVVSLEGSISAEHGIGRAKAPYLHLQRNKAEIELFTEIKKAFDPKTILNPNVIISSGK